MNKLAITVWIYALFMLIGGIIGFIKAGSIMSLVMGFAILGVLGWTGYLLWTNQNKAKRINMYALGTILIIMVIRFILTFKILPAVLAAVTAFVLKLVTYSPSNGQQSNSSSKHSEN